jgi:hypothetical protein
VADWVLGASREEQEVELEASAVLGEEEGSRVVRATGKDETPTQAAGLVISQQSSGGNKRDYGEQRNCGTHDAFPGGYLLVKRWMRRSWILGGECTDSGRPAHAFWMPWSSRILEASRLVRGGVEP